MNVIFSPEITFWVFGLVIFSPLFFFKSAFVKLTLAIYAYPIWVMFGLWVGIPATRVIRNVGIDFYDAQLGSACFYSLLSYCLFVCSLRKLRDRDYSFHRIPLTVGQRVFFLVMLILVLPVAYPAAWGVGSDRFGSFGSLVVVFFAVIVCSKSNSSKFDVLLSLVAALIMFMVFHGERVDFILMFAAIYIIAKGTSFVSLYKLAILVSFFLVIGIYGGINRAGGALDVTELFSIVSFAITNFGTAVDVVHVYLSSSWYYENISSDFRPIINVISSYLPLLPKSGAGSDYNFVWILREYIDNVGGGTFYTASMMAAGGFGVVISGYVYGVLFRFLFRQELYYSPVFIAFFVMQFRLQWYGLTYFGNVIFSMTILWAVLYVIRKQGLVVSKNKRLGRQLRDIEVG